MYPTSATSIKQANSDKSEFGWSDLAPIPIDAARNSLQPR
jgi:hypothetical protein